MAGSLSFDLLFTKDFLSSEFAYGSLRDTLYFGFLFQLFCSLFDVDMIVVH